MYLYKFDFTAKHNEMHFDCEGLDLKVLTPSLRTFLKIKGENLNLKTICVRFLFQLMTLGKTKIYYVRVRGELVHTSYVVPACVKFPFMDKQSLEIGPCYTYPEFRGKGIYPRVLIEICKKHMDASAIYMIVDETNLSSIRGIEKAGFVKCGAVYRSRFTKRYKCVL